MAIGEPAIRGGTWLKLSKSSGSSSLGDLAFFLLTVLERVFTNISLADLHQCQQVAFLTIEKAFPWDGHILTKEVLP